MKDHTIKQQQCPGCGYRMDTSADVYNGGRAPEEGDISICLSCGAPTIFTKEGTLRTPTTQEKLDLSQNKQVLEAQLVRASVVGDKIKQRINKQQQNERRRQSTHSTDL